MQAAPQALGLRRRTPSWAQERTRRYENGRAREALSAPLGALTDGYWSSLANQPDIADCTVICKITSYMCLLSNEAPPLGA